MVKTRKFLLSFLLVTVTVTVSVIVTVAVYEQFKSSKLVYHVPVTMCVANFHSYHLFCTTHGPFLLVWFTQYKQHIQTEEARKSACLHTDLLIIPPTGILQTLYGVFLAFLCRVCIVS